MNIAQSGVIVFVQRYEQCISFYRDRLALPVVEAQPDLTRFAFGGAYLMIERGDIAAPRQKSRDRNPVVLRFDVVNVAETAAELSARGVAVDLHEFSWGAIGVFVDPDGNRCELKNAGA